MRSRAPAAIESLISSSDRAHRIGIRSSFGSGSAATVPLDARRRCSERPVTAALLVSSVKRTAPNGSIGNSPGSLTAVVRCGPTSASPHSS